MKLKDTAKERNNDLEPFQWLNEMAEKSELCLFWKQVMEFDFHILLLIRSIRESNFTLFVETLRKVIKWYFVYDHYNYARWLSVHIFDLLMLHVAQPDTYQSMMQGFFSFQKTQSPFSSMALDQVHEQNNSVIKGNSSVIDLLNKEDQSALVRWETCGPGIARMIMEIEDALLDDYTSSNSPSCNRKHHEDNVPFQE